MPTTSSYNSGSMGKVKMKVEELDSLVCVISNNGETIVPPLGVVLGAGVGDPFDVLKMHSAWRLGGTWTSGQTSTGQPVTLIGKLHVGTLPFVMGATLPQGGPHEVKFGSPH